MRLQEAMTVFDVIGLAGNTSPDPRHVSWLHWRDGNSKTLRLQDRQLLSGVVGHFELGGQNICGYGLTPQECVLLDGCFLAAEGTVLRERNTFFDEQFAFDFYDLDFCRTAESRGLLVGTWPIAVTHASVGRFGNPAWETALERYQKKWGKP